MGTPPLFLAEDLQESKLLKSGHRTVNWANGLSQTWIEACHGIPISWERMLHRFDYRNSFARHSENRDAGGCSCRPCRKGSGCIYAQILPMLGDPFGNHPASKRQKADREYSQFEKDERKQNEAGNLGSNRDWPNLAFGLNGARYSSLLADQVNVNPGSLRDSYRSTLFGIVTCTNLKCASIKSGAPFTPEQASQQIGPA
jgi:hypothetical protein